MRRRRLSAALLTLLLTGTVPALPSAAQGDESSATTLTLDPMGGGSISGLAVLTERDGDTAANVLAVGAPAGAIAVIHGGTCAAVDPTPVGLLGDVGTTGQLAATVPIPFATIADGAHVLAIHPGLDLATTIACGAIPSVVTSGGLPTASPSPTAPPRAVATPSPVPVPTPSPSPTPDAGCAGMDAWVAGTLSRFDALKRIADELAAAMNAGMAAYAQTLADDSVAVQQLQIEQQQAAVPVAATDIQADLIRMYQKLAEAYDLMAQGYRTGNTGALQQGLNAAGEAQALATSTRDAVRRAATPCGITVPAV